MVVKLRPGSGTPYISARSEGTDDEKRDFSRSVSIVPGHAIVREGAPGSLVRVYLPGAFSA